MASRFYMENTVVQSSGVTAIDSTWTTDLRVPQGVPGRTLKLIPSGTTPTTTSYSTPSGQPALATPPNRYTMHVMYEYTLPVGLLITGTVRAELAGFRQNNTNNVSRSIAAHIRNGGTHKATVVQAFTATNFYGFTPGHVQALLATPIVDDGYITVAGDVLYLEVGLGWAAIASDCNVTVGYNNANADWPDGADGTPDTNPTVLNPWFEFMTTLAAAPAADDFLPTLSATTVTARPSSPSKPGLHFFDRTTHIESIWDGTSWTNMLSGISGVTGGILGFSSTFGVSVTISGSTATWNAQALSAETNRNRTLRLTDDGTEGALLTASTTFAANAIALMAPNATNALRVGKYGNISMAGTALTDQLLLSFSKSNYDEAAVSPSAMSVLLVNTNIGDAAGGLITGINMNLSGTLSTAAAPSFRNVEGIRIAVTGGASGNSRFQGSVVGFRTSTMTVNSSTVGTTVTSVVDFQSSTTNTFLRSAVADKISFEAKGSVTLAISGTLLNHYGFKANALTAGSTRVSYHAAAITTGTPAIAYGFQSVLHAVGITRRSFIGDNTFESPLSDYLCNTASRGLMSKDTQGTPRFWRTFVDATGNSGMTMTVDSDGFASFARTAAGTGNVILNVVDTGTAAPAT